MENITKATAVVDSGSETKSLISFDKGFPSEGINSNEFIDKNKLLFDLVESNGRSSSELDIREIINISEISDKVIPSDRIVLESWKNIQNFSARLIEVLDNEVILEILIDKELGQYEERIFCKDLFNGYNLKVGSLFYLRYSRRQHEEKLEVHDGTNIVSETDFPIINISELFKKSKLFNR